nr:hypothetical protein [Nostoc sp. EkiNYC01]
GFGAVAIAESRYVLRLKGRLRPRIEGGGRDSSNKTRHGSDAATIELRVLVRGKTEDERSRLAKESRSRRIRCQSKLEWKKPYHVASLGTAVISFSLRFLKNNPFLWLPILGQNGFLVYAPSNIKRWD